TNHLTFRHRLRPPTPATDTDYQHRPAQMPTQSAEVLRRDATRREQRSRANTSIHHLTSRHQYRC
ncbi:hypothetical protein HMPREF9080_02045, partial [Cardiobacterium valvarum F0432]